jgi:hypothetical protein
MLLNADTLDVDMVRNTLNVLLKHEQDFAAIDKSIPELTNKAKRY